MAADQPQWGHAWSRNLLSEEKNLPESFDPATGKNVKWAAPLGTETYCTPIVAAGRVYIGTNNEEPRDPRHKGDRGVLLCLDEATGKLLWQLVVPKREDDPYCDWPKSGLSSPVTVEGNRVYVVSNRGEVMCLDARGMANGNDGPFRDEGAHMTPKPAPAADGAQPAPAIATTAMQPGPLDADILWLFDLTSGAGIWSHDSAHSSILIHGDHLYLNSGTGVDNTHRVIRTPDAPSLVVLDKKSGRYLARDKERIAPNIFHCTWSSPSMGKVNGQSLVILAGGDGVVYAFTPLGKKESTKRSDSPVPLKKAWEFTFDPEAPRENVHRYSQNRRESPSNFYGMPLFVRERIYMAGGGDIFWGKRQAWLKCIDASGKGDISEKGLVWSYPLEKHVLATPVLHEGLLFIADIGRKFHCVDAASGKARWTHDIDGEVWASPLVADGKVYFGTKRGEFYVFAAAKEKKLLAAFPVGAPINATATAANGVLYVATMNRLFAVQQR